MKEIDIEKMAREIAHEIATRVRAGAELGEVDKLAQDIIFNTYEDACSTTASVFLIAAKRLLFLLDINANNSEMRSQFTNISDEERAKFEGAKKAYSDTYETAEKIFTKYVNFLIKNNFN